MLLHFVQGMPHNNFSELDFTHGGSDYTVTAVVQYKKNPDHFIAWLRNAPGNCNSSKAPVFVAMLTNILRPKTLF